MVDSTHGSKRIECVGCVIVTVSDTRTAETDKSGRIINDLLGQAGHRVVDYSIVPDEPTEVGDIVSTSAGRSDVSAVLVTGGTGLAPRDTTYEAVCRLYGKKLDGFGELFRSLSYEEIGAAAMLSRASAGTVSGAIVFSMPGSTSAVRLAMEKLIIPQLSHLAAVLAE